MISPSVRSEAFTMLDVLTSKGVALSAKQATVLADLTHSCESITRPVDNTLSSALDLVTQGANITNDKLPGASPHDAAMCVAVNKIVPTVRNLQWLIKERVVPIARRVTEGASQEVSEQVAYGGINFRVEVVHHMEVIKNPLFAALWDGYSDVGLAEEGYPQYLQSFAPVSAQELREYLHTGVSRIDGQLQPWIDSITDEALVTFWNTYFVDQHPISLQNLQATMPTVEFESLMIMLFLVSHNILSYDRFDNASVNRSYLSNACTKLAAMCATQLRIAASRLHLINETGELARVVRLPQAKPGVSVNYSALVEEVPYSQFIERGGTDEAIYGALLAGRPLYVAELLDNQEKFERLYAQHRIQNETNQRNNIAGALRRAVNKLLQAELLSPETSVLVVNTAETSKKIYDEVEQLGLHQLENLYEVCADMVCRHFFPYSGAGRFMRSFNTLASTYPDLTGGEIARLATMEYVARYVVSLVEVKRS